MLLIMEVAAAVLDLVDHLVLPKQVVPDTKV
jgi:hypothetical protein